MRVCGATQTTEQMTVSITSSASFLGHSPALCC